MHKQFSKSRKMCRFCETCVGKTNTEKMWKALTEIIRLICRPESTVTLCSDGKTDRLWTRAAERILTARLLIQAGILTKLFNGGVEENVVQNEIKGWTKYATALSAVQTCKEQWLLYIYIYIYIYHLFWYSETQHVFQNTVLLFWLSE
jgi:hypothetical protein